MSLIFDIKRYSINDGPGIRLTIFFKGCPLNCVWCHNPEGISPKREKLHNRQKCIHCKSCVASCPNSALAMEYDDISTDANLCINCGECTEACPTGALEISGKEISADDIMKEIRKETIVFDQSEGGVTFCGGEPLMHKTMLMELLKRCGELRIHRAVDTCLYASEETLLEVAGNCELILADLKHMDSNLHMKYTGVGNELIVSNIRSLANKGFNFIVRIPLIEGVNANEENILESAKFLSSLPDAERRPVELLPYHNIGVGKHSRMGSKYNPEKIHMDKPSAEKIQRSIEIFAENGITATSR
jgi:pyruvate formate lyase activating enzyme